MRSGIKACHSLRRLRESVEELTARVRGWKEYRRFRNLSAKGGNRFPLRWKERLYIPDERTPATTFDRHYVLHPAWAARILARTRPQAHIDISSTLNFCTIVSAFVPVRFYDYRPADLHLPGLLTGQADLLDLPFESRSVPSLSCMHVVEHVGLGRYGDPLDPDGDRKAIAELARVLAPGGTLLFVVPVGRPRIVFNAHRIYSYEQVRDLFSDLELADFALIPDRPDDGALVSAPTRELLESQEYGCGCFHFRRGR